MSIEDKDLLQQATKLYLKRLLITLPLSLLMIGAYQAILFGQKLGYNQASMFLVILYLPLFSAMVILLHQRLTQQAFSFSEFLALVFRKFISLLGCLISMSLFPVFVFAIGMILYLLAGKFFPQLHPLILFSFYMLILIATFLAFIPKMMAPILIFTEDQDANSSIEVSEKRVKGHFGRTLLYSTFGTLLLIWIAGFPGWISQVLLVFLIPWVIALWLVLSFKP